ncbi:acetyltransferase [Candidatus Chloroploca asiatica]|nr:acetyltransferase [Candidatus Chloroploca asiatica]
MSNTRPLYIFGSSGHAREVAAYAQISDPTRRIVYVDPHNQGEDIISLEAYYEANKISPGETVIGAGSGAIRRRMMHEIRPPFATIIHPSAVVLGSIGPGCVIAPGAVVAPNARLSAMVLVNYNATIGHDTLVETLAVIGPGAAVGGWCRVGSAAYVGAGALIRERLQIGDDAVIGMGAVVVKNVPDNAIATGVPAVWRS